MAENCLGESEWDLAQQHMNALKSVFSHQAIAKQFSEITADLGN